VLLVIRAQAAVVGAAVRIGVLNFRGIWPGLERLARQLVVLDVGGNQHLLKPMFGAPLVQVDVVISKTTFASTLRRHVAHRLLGARQKRGYRRSDITISRENDRLRTHHS
jgi:hypothetical protein